MADTILILGGGRMQLPAIHIARRRGWRVLLADGNGDCLGRPLADAFFHIDLVDREALAEMATGQLGRDGLRGVFTAGTDFSAAVASVAERCGLPGLPLAVARAASDKLLMRGTLAKAGVPQPAFAGLGPGDDPLPVAGRIGYPVVVKPVDNMGARGVGFVEQEEALPSAFQAALSASRSSRAIVEEYMSGAELSLDAIVYRGRVTVCGVADRHITFPPYFVEMGHTMPSALERRLLAEAAEVFARGIAALGIENGAAKGDIKMTPRGAMVGEIAARLSGGYMSGWTFPYASGVEVTEAALDIAMGLAPGDLSPKSDLASAERALVSIPGRVARIEGLVEAGAPAELRDFFLLAKPGDDVRLPTNNVQKCGNAISRAASREAATRAAEEAVRRAFVRLEPGHPLTEVFLAESGGFAAFGLSREANRAALERMPDTVAGDGPVGVLLLPDVRGESGRDWHGEGFAEAVQRALSLAGAQARETGGPLLGRRFWRAFLKGGVQGGVWAVETYRTRERRAGIPGGPL